MECKLSDWAIFVGVYFPTTFSKCALNPRNTPTYKEAQVFMPALLCQYRLRCKLVGLTKLSIFR